jgi:hypothetical protein
MDRAEIVACGANGEDIFSAMSSNSRREKKCLAFRGSLQNSLWVKTYGNAYDDRMLSVEITADGGLFAAGYNGQLTDLAWQAMAVKLNSAGKISWAKGFDEQQFSSSRGCQLKDGKYMIWGSTAKSNKLSEDAFLLILSSSGGILTQKAYGVTGNDNYLFNHAEKVKDGGTIACGEVRREDTYGWLMDSKGWLVKLNASGNILFQYLFANSMSADEKYFQLGDIHQTSDGGYICAGAYDSSNEGDRPRLWVGKLDAGGKVTWQKAYEAFYKEGEIEGMYPEKIIPTKDGGYAVVGVESGWRPWGSWCIKLDGSGELEWTARFELDFWDDVDARDIIQTSDGGFIVAGSLYKSNVADHGWLIKLNGLGKLVFQKAYRLGAENAGFSAVRQFAKGGFIFAGHAHTDVFFASNGQRLESDAALLMTTNSNGLTLAKVPPKTYKARVKAMRVDEAIPKITISRGAAKSRTSKFAATNITLVEKAWGVSAAASGEQE